MGAGGVSAGFLGFIQLIFASELPGIYFVLAQNWIILLKQWGWSCLSDREELAVVVNKYKSVVLFWTGIKMLLWISFKNFLVSPR